MKKLLYYHMMTIVIYLLGIMLPLGMILFSKHLIDFDIPIIVLAICVMSCPLVSACVRIGIWKKKQQLLSPEALGSIGARIFFMLIPAEFLVFIVGIGFLFL